MCVISWLCYSYVRYSLVVSQIQTSPCCSSSCQLGDEETLGWLNKATRGYAADDRLVIMITFILLSFGYVRALARCQLVNRVTYQ